MVYCQVAGVIEAYEIHGCFNLWTLRHIPGSYSTISYTVDSWLSEASKALKNIIRGKVFVDVEEIKGNTVVEAAKMVFGRHKPTVRRSENLNLNADLKLVDLEKYRNR